MVNGTQIDKCLALAVTRKELGLFPGHPVMFPTNNKLKQVI